MTHFRQKYPLMVVPFIQLPISTTPSFAFWKILRYLRRYHTEIFFTHWMSKITSWPFILNLKKKNPLNLLMEEPIMTFHYFLLFTFSSSILNNLDLNKINIEIQIEWNKNKNEIDIKFVKHI